MFVTFQMSNKAKVHTTKISKGKNRHFNLSSFNKNKYQA